MEKRKLLFVFNPHSGKAQIRPNLLQIIDIFTKAGYDVTAYPTQCQADAYNKVKADGAFYDHIVCSGGDGTLDETVSAIMDAGLKTNLGYIPAGSTNDFANSLDIPKDMVKAANIAVNGTPFLCDVGKMDGVTFVYVAAFGLFTDVSYQTDQGLKNMLGHAAYILEGAKRLGQIESYRVKVEANGEVYEDDWIYGMVSNSKSIGGFSALSGKDVELDDGVFEVLLIKMPRNPIELNETLACLLKQEFDFKHLYAFKSDEVTFTFENPTCWTRDGEFGGSYTKVQINNCQKQVPFMVAMSDK
ncbi:MAG: YegS/Rv2252/BmrU family lipid kinase [Lachnospiraceae bacterium]|jgi:YegS/Rv2252/BmrU family lipid kinase|nr:YegS/Rv2252/BmrU family lipid kinase [Lachnospiraceae bacterium]